MVPNVKQRVIRSGTTFVITCTFVHTTAIEWKLPDYLTRFKEVGEPHMAIALISLFMDIIIKLCPNDCS